MQLLRNLGRRKLRTGLTIAGITIGIWALVVFSSMANKINSLVDGGREYYGNKIVVSDASGGGFSTLPVSIDSVAVIEALPGVDVAIPQISFLADPEAGVSFTQPEQVLAEVAGADRGLEDFELNAAQGRLLTADDERADVVVLGSDIARSRDAEIGGSIELYGRTFEIVGILEPTLTAPDTSIFMPFAPAQSMLIEQLPPFVRGQIETTALASSIVVYPAVGSDIAAVAAAIEAAVPNTSTMTGEDFDEVIGSTTAIFNAIITGVALISLIVGGLSVINTMAMSVAERTREIGIKRAIGAGRRRIVRELMVEAGLIGLLGGLLGLALGAGIVVLANEAGRAGGTILFELTASTAIFSVAFATVLGVVAGVIPAWHAARLDPVQALRYE